MVKKLRLTLLPVLLLCLALGMSVSAAAGPIIDDADLFSESEENKLTEQINALKSYTGMDYLVVTTDDAQGMNAQDYADTTYYNSGASEDALLYLIDMDNREIYVYTEGMMIRYITDARLEEILDGAYEEVADGEYYTSAYSVLSDVESFYKEGIHEGQHNYDEVTGETDYYNEPEEEEGLLLFGIIFFMLIGMIPGGIAALIKSWSTKRSYNLDYDTYEYPVAQKSKLELNVSEDRLINKFVTHRRIERDDDDHHDSGRSTVHHASSGRSHGGGGRKF